MSRSASVRIALNSQLKVGQFSFSQQDVTIPVQGVPLTLIRTYNTLNREVGDFGYSWTYAISDGEMEIDEYRIEETDLFDNRFSMRTGGGRNVTLTMPDSGRRVTFTYYTIPAECNEGDGVDLCQQALWRAPQGKLLTQIDNTRTTVYSYVAGHLEGIYYPNGGSIRYERDLLARITGVVMNAASGNIGHRVAYGYDRAGNLTSIVDPIGGETTLEYDPVNRPVRRTYPNGVTTLYEYNDKNLITGIMHKDTGGVVLASARYEREGIGEPVKIIREDGSFIVLGYDASIRLNRESYYDAMSNLVEDISYTYDAAGNRLSMSNASDFFSYNYDPGHQLALIDRSDTNDAFYMYDASGRVVANIRDGKHLAFTYDSNDRIISVEDLATSELIRYTYDGNGRRVKMENSAGATRHFLVAPTFSGLESPQLVVDEHGELVTRYVYVNDDPLLRIGGNGQVVYYLEDAVKSIIGLADDMGRSSAIFHYDGFGNIRSSSGPASQVQDELVGDFRFHGVPMDTISGLHFMRARHYDSQMGPFMSRDPAEPRWDMPESTHMCLQTAIRSFSRPIRVILTCRDKYHRSN